MNLMVCKHDKNSMNFKLLSRKRCYDLIQHKPRFTMLLPRCKTSNPVSVIHQTDTSDVKPNAYYEEINHQSTDVRQMP